MTAADSAASGIGDTIKRKRFRVSLKYIYCNTKPCTGWNLLLVATDDHIALFASGTVPHTQFISDAEVSGRPPASLT